MTTQSPMVAKRFIDRHDGFAFYKLYASEKPHPFTWIGDIRQLDSQRWELGAYSDKDMGICIRTTLARLRKDATLREALAAVRLGVDYFHGEVADDISEDGPSYEEYWERNSYDPEAQADLELFDAQFPNGYGR